MLLHNIVFLITWCKNFIELYIDTIYKFKLYKQKILKRQHYIVWSDIKMNFNKLISTIFILLFVILILSFPQISVSSALNGLNLWFNIVFPSLLPFLVANELLIGLGFVSFLGVLLEPFMRTLFNVPGSGAFGLAMGFMCGYPTGAKITKDLREKNLCTKIEGERMLTFTNNSGPLFIIGAVSVGMFNNPELGLVLALAHYTSAITVGILFRWYHSSTLTPTPLPNLGEGLGVRIEKGKKNIFLKAICEMVKSQKKDGRNFGILVGDAIRNSVNLLLMIGGFIIIFSVIISLLNQLNVLSSFAEFISNMFNNRIDKSAINSILNGIFEITNGTKSASISNSEYIYKIASASFIIGWAGLSVHLQVISIISSTDLSYVPYLFGKFIQGIIGAIYSVILFKLLLLSPTVTVFGHFEKTNYSWLDYFINSGEFLMWMLVVLIGVGVAIAFISSNINTKKRFN